FQSGSLRFSALAQGTGPVVLLLHGFPDNADSYRLQLPALASLGFRAISVHLRGYEPSSIPNDGDYSDNAIAQDIVAIIDQIGEERVHLVGHDWGAIKSYAVASQFSERFKSLTTMAVPHIGRFMADMTFYPRQLRLSWYVFFFQIRGISDYVLKRRDYDFVRMLWRHWSPGWEPPEDELAAVIETLKQPGVTRAALGYYRELLKLGNVPITSGARRRAAFPVPVPTLALTGERDGCIDSDVFTALMREEDFPVGLSVHKIAKAGHWLHQEQPQEVNSLLLSWLQKHESSEAQ
ncbi:MAG: alpha/beta hydrolase, partial [Pseudomonadota bacterium]